MRNILIICLWKCTSNCKYVQYIQSIPKIACQQYWVFNCITNINYELKYLLLTMFSLSSSCSWKWEPHSMECFTDVLISLCQANHEKTMLQNSWNSSRIKQQCTVLLDPKKKSEIHPSISMIKMELFKKKMIFTQIQSLREWNFHRLSAAAISRPQTASYCEGKSLANFMPVSTHCEPLLQPAGNVQRRTLLQHNKKRRGISLEWDS